MPTEHSRGLVWVARPAGQSAELVALLEADGYQALVAPVLEITSLEESELATADKLLVDIGGFEHVIFVSANAAEYGLRRMCHLDSSAALASLSAEPMAPTSTP